MLERVHRKTTTSNDRQWLTEQQASHSAGDSLRIEAETSGILKQVTAR